MAKRWFTCTPVAFGGGPDFFARDSGLLSCGLREIGVESMAVMPGPRMPDDEPGLIRTEYANLESAEWWRSHGLDGVVLYAWGRPRFRKVAAAIREAGIFLVLNQDNGGVISPLNGLGAWLTEQKILSGAGRVGGGWLRFFKMLAKDLSLGLALIDPLRAKHLSQGHVIACVSPTAADHYRHLCRIYRLAGADERIRVIPHSVNPVFDYNGEPKRREVVVIGRWNDPIQKRPGLMMAVVGELVASDPEVCVRIVGGVIPELEAWHGSLRERDRVGLLGRVEPTRISELLRGAQVSYCPSAFESFHIASGEALCSGCSVVAARLQTLASFPWFCSEDSGSLAASDDLRGHVGALRAELDAWDGGGRDAGRISEVWKSRLHAVEVAKLVIGLVDA